MATKTLGIARMWKERAAMFFILRGSAGSLQKTLNFSRKQLSEDEAAKIEQAIAILRSVDERQSEVYKTVIKIRFLEAAKVEHEALMVQHPLTEAEAFKTDETKQTPAGIGGSGAGEGGGNKAPQPEDNFEEGSSGEESKQPLSDNDNNSDSVVPGEQESGVPAQLGEGTEQV